MTAPSTASLTGADVCSVCPSRSQETTADKRISDNFKMPRVAWSNGIAGGVRTVPLRLPDNYYLVLFATSPELDVSSLFNVGVSAFQEGMKHDF